MQESTLTYLNGEFIAAPLARVALADRGFRFGDGVFATLRLVDGVPYQWALHLARLLDGLQALRIAPPVVDWRSIAAQLLEKSAASEGFLRISVSRGVGSRGYLPLATNTPSWAMELLPPVAAPGAPYRLWCSSIAKIPPQCLPTQYKLAQGVNSTLAAMDAQAQGCDDALQCDIHGMVSETSSANLFWVSGGDIFTPALTTGCLAGTTRTALIRLSPRPIQEVAAPLTTLQQAEALWISNVRLGLHPIAEIQPFGWAFDPQHPILHDLAQRLADDRAQCCWSA